MKEAGGTSEVHKTLLAFPFSFQPLQCCCTGCCRNVFNPWEPKGLGDAPAASPLPLATDAEPWICVALAIQVRWDQWIPAGVVLPRRSRGAGAHFSAEGSSQIPHGHCSWHPCLLDSVMGWKMSRVADVVVRICLCHPFFLTSFWIPKCGGSCTHREGILFSFTARVEKGSICSSPLHM